MRHRRRPAALRRSPSGRRLQAEPAVCRDSFAALVNDLLPQTPNGEDTPRNRCLEFIKDLARWENSNNEELIGQARKLIAAAHKFLHPDADGDMPKVLDPFAVRELFQAPPINLSVAIWVGFLALFGIASDDGVVMATYLNQSFKNRAPKNVGETRAATLAAGMRRIRPCLLTIETTILALLPVLTSTGRGADIMVPMAIPSFGGMTIEIITMLVVPVLFCAFQEIRFKVNAGAAQAAPQPPPSYGIRIRFIGAMKRGAQKKSHPRVTLWFMPMPRAPLWLRVPGAVGWSSSGRDDRRRRHHHHHHRRIHRHRCAARGAWLR